MIGRMCLVSLFRKCLNVTFYRKIPIVKKRENSLRRSGISSEERFQRRNFIWFGGLVDVKSNKNMKRHWSPCSGNCCWFFSLKIPSRISSKFCYEQFGLILWWNIYRTVIFFKMWKWRLRKIISYCRWQWPNGLFGIKTYSWFIHHI